MSYLVAVIIVALLLLWAYVRYLERKNLYFPTSEIYQTPDDVGLQYEDANITTADGVKIHGWYFPVNEPKGVALFFHGNGENITHRLDVAQFFHERGYEALLLDYRGYGKSEGSPNEEGLYNDARAAYDFLVEQKSKRPEDIIVYGFSLGGSVAIDLASKVDISALIVQSGFTSAVDMGKKLYPYLPVGKFMSQRYESIPKLSKIKAPVLIIHSPDDELVPYDHGKKLFENAPEPKAFIESSGGHNDTFHFTDEECAEKLTSFLEKHRMRD
jgi:fermentation-respiration switch protein FrsA (DUF1100 family)